MTKKFMEQILNFLAFSWMMVLVYSKDVLADQTSQPKLDTGDTAWMLISSALVMFMTIPGLALFYGGLAKKKDVLNTIAMSFVAYCIVSLLWVVYGYSLSFSGDIKGMLGNFDKILLKGISIDSLQGTIPEVLFCMYQLTFAGVEYKLCLLIKYFRGIIKIFNIF